MKDARKSPAVMLRLPVELVQWFKHQAIDNRRSLNGELLHRLEDSKKRQEQHKEPANAQT